MKYTQMLACSGYLFDSEVEGHIFLPHAELNEIAGFFLQGTGVGGREMVPCPGYPGPGHGVATQEHYT